MYDAYARYALFWVPSADSALAEFGYNWTGWCAERGQHMARRPLAGIGSMLGRITAEIGRCGLHGVVAAPFALRKPCDAWRLEQMLEYVAVATAPIQISRLKPALVGSRVALLPESPCPELGKLIGRARAALSPLQSAGAPEFREAGEPFFGALEPRGKPAPCNLSSDRFHIPLTDATTPFLAERVLRALPKALILAPPTPLEIADIALMGDPGEGRPMVVLSRMRLTGQVKAQSGGSGSGGLFETRGPRLYGRSAEIIQCPSAGPALAAAID